MPLERQPRTAGAPTLLTCPPFADAAHHPVGSALAHTGKRGRDCAPMRAWSAAAAVAVALAGCGSDAKPSSREPAKPPSGTFDVQGHGMFIECKGEGEPAVILDSG